MKVISYMHVAHFPDENAARDYAWQLCKDDQFFTIDVGHTPELWEVIAIVDNLFVEHRRRLGNIARRFGGAHFSDGVLSVDGSEGPPDSSWDDDPPEPKTTLRVGDTLGSAPLG
jgi:hypothetical protein